MLLYCCTRHLIGHHSNNAEPLLSLYTSSSSKLCLESTCRGTTHRQTRTVYPSKNREQNTQDMIHKESTAHHLVGVEGRQTVSLGVHKPDAGLVRPARAGNDDHPLQAGLAFLRGRRAAAAGGVRSRWRSPFIVFTHPRGVQRRRVGWW